MHHIRYARPALLLIGAVLVAPCGSDRVAPVVFPDLLVSTETLPAAFRGQTYTEAVHAEGGDGDYAWEVTGGQLPPGLAMVVDDQGEDHAILSGVPEAEGTFDFTLTVTSGDGQSASGSFSLEVLPEVPLSIETPAVPPALEGGPYDVRLAAYGGDGTTFVWEVVSGALPPGLELTSGGRIQGTPAGTDTAHFTVEVRSNDEAVQKSYDLAVVPNRPGEYNITIFPVTPVPPGLVQHLEAAIQEWEAVFTSNLPAVHIPPTFFAAEHCDGFGELINGTSTDDLLIIINIAPIDGPGGVLGRAGACGIRGGSDLPFAGVVTLDSDDLLPLAGNETATHIIAHEIAHVAGFGTLWQLMDLVAGAGTNAPRFTGPAAVAEYVALGGDEEDAVPLETRGGPATRDAHWHEADFGNELMTGFSAPAGVFQPTSRITIASFADLGYDVDLSRADSFTLSAALATDGHGHHRWRELGYDEIIRGPIRVLEPDGRHRTIQPR